MSNFKRMTPSCHCLYLRYCSITHCPLRLPVILSYDCLKKQKAYTTFSAQDVELLPVCDRRCKLFRF